MEKIIKRTYEGALKYRGETILKYKLEYPEMVNSRYLVGQNMFNSFYERKAKKLLTYINTELYKEAKDVYDFNKQNGYPIMVFEAYLVYEITYNSNGIISLYNDEYTFRGGAHGNTIRTSETWELFTGKQLSLQETWNKFYNKQTKNCNYVIEILKSINKQVEERLKENEGSYFDDYCMLILETFNFNNFYLTEKCIVIYFNQYDIAPYSTGIPTFCI